ncbi:hypothetical protein CLF_101538 [Clonorchis sinensis]|uniref:Uncharacterized protein n=1 Tax=Clonorchis sinensis TaxID=79923 RepID=G7Y5Z8_CLOSI|nr:hypothetical protein CLF_101538 [Clonorchis sinensis]
MCENHRGINLVDVASKVLPGLILRNNVKQGCHRSHFPLNFVTDTIMEDSLSAPDASGVEMIPGCSLTDAVLPIQSPQIIGGKYSLLTADDDDDLEPNNAPVVIGVILIATSKNSVMPHGSSRRVITRSA